MISFRTARPFSARRLRSGGRLPGQRQLDPPLGEDVVGDAEAVEDPGHADVRHGLIDDLLDLNGGDAHGERRAEHDSVLGHGLAGDHRRELDHEPGPGVEAAIAEDFVQGEVVEVLNELRVGLRERRDVTGEQLVVVASCYVASRRERGPERAPTPTWAAADSPRYQRILDAHTAPAWVRNGRSDVLAINRLGRALYAPVFDDPVRPANAARFLFLSPRGREFYRDWDRTANDMVAVLRAEAGRDPYDKG